MKTGHLTKLFTWALIAQMVLSPVVHAIDIAATRSQTLQQTFSAQQAALAQAQAQQRSLARRSAIDPRRCNGNFCNSEFFPGCRILQDIPTILSVSACSDQLDPSNQADQSKYIDALALLSDYTFMEDQYRSAQSESPQALNTGLTCLARASANLERSLLARENQIDALIREMNVTQDTQFKPALEADLAVIEDAQAQLEGAAFQGRKAGLAQNSFKFADSFKTAPCNAVFGETEFETTGTARGFNGIQARMQAAVSTPAQAGGPGSFAAAGFNADTARNLTNQITSISNAISADIRNGGPERLSSASAGINDPYGLISNTRLVPAILQEQQRAEASFRRELDQEYGRYASSDAGLQSAIYASTDEEFDNTVSQFRQRRNTQCLNAHPNVVGLLSGTIAMNIVGASKDSSRENAYRQNLVSIFNETSTSLEAKQRAVTALGSNNYRVRVPDTITIQVPGSCGSGFNRDANGRVQIKPGSQISPADFLNLHICNCDAQLNASNGGKASTNQMLTNLAQTRARYSTYRKNLPQQVATAINTRLNNCVDNQQASAAGVGTCSATDLSTSSQTFCVARALNCANRMNGCYAVAQQQVRNVTARRDVSVGRYRANVQRNKAQLVTMYGRLSQLISIQDQAIMNSALREEVVLPPNVKLNLTFDQRVSPENYVRGLASLEIEKPEVYLQQAIANLNEVKAALATQRENIMNGNNRSSLQSEGLAAAGGVSGHIRRIRESMQTAQQRIEQAKSECNQTISQYRADFTRMEQEQRRAANEAAGNLNTLCTNYSAFSASPGCESEDTFESIIDAATQANQRGSAEAIAVGDYARYCRSLNSDRNDSDDSRQLDEAGREREGIAYCANSENASKSECRVLALVRTGDLCTSLPTPSTENTPATGATTANTQAPPNVTSDQYRALIGLFDITDEDNHGCTTQRTGQAIPAACLTYLRGQWTENTSNRLVSFCEDYGTDNVSVRRRQAANTVYQNHISNRRAVANAGDPNRWDRSRQLGENRPAACSGQVNSLGGAAADAAAQAILPVSNSRGLGNQ